MSTPESKIKEQVKVLLRKYQAYFHMPVMNGLGAPTLDFVCCLKGRYFGIETKAPGKKPTPRQENTMKQIREAGGLAFVIDGDMTILETWLKLINGERQ